MKRHEWVLSLLLLAAACGGVPEPPVEPATTDAAAAPVSTDYATEIEAWRTERAERLGAEDGWLTLTGLYWLEPGANGFGSAPDNAIVLPDGPARAGVLYYEGDHVRVEAAPDAGVHLAGESPEPVGERVLTSDAAGEADVLAIGRASFYVIQRGDRMGVRVKDPEAPARREFRGLDYYPTDARWRVRARFEPYDEPREIEVPTVLGTTETMQAPGIVRFALGEGEHTLTALREAPEDEELFFVFADRTSGQETYGAGRFLYAKLDGGVVDLDFNRAYNPPCAFTPYATCPLPPPGNRLEVAVEAGEKSYRGHGAH